MQWEVTFFFCKTTPPKLYYEFIVGNHPKLIEKNLRKLSREFKVATFPMLSIQFCCGIQPQPINRKPHETPTKTPRNSHETPT